MEFMNIRYFLIIVLIVLFIIIVARRTKESLRWVLVGEEFGEKGEQLHRDYELLADAGFEVRLERGVKTSIFFRRFSKDLADRVAIYALKEDIDRVERFLTQPKKRR